ncbi:MAG: hypothetical protein MN733_37270, partial [Nitrososphaera sp.]|nr:hypothetical protein [Nitrososphaera sp.]
MSFEDEIAQLNEHFFFREFTYSKNTFRPSPTAEAELADSILWLGDVVVAFQLKERNISGATTAEEESRWFERKVLSRGTQQIRDTLTYLRSHDVIEIGNHRGHKFHLDSSKITTMHKVICYLANDFLPDECGAKKFYRSGTAGIIHLIQAKDYLGIVRTLLTPPELSEYLSFREELIEKWDDAVNSVPEPALVGQYLCGDADTSPNSAFLEYLSALEHRIDEWDMSGIIKQFPDRVTTDNETTDYYSIVAELAKLKRNELREFKKRFQLTMEKCRSNEFVQPYRFACPRTDCGFVFIPLEREFLDHRQQGLQNLTYACKYDLKLPKCIGVSFAPEKDGWYSVEWCYMEFPWGFDAEVDERLKQNNPFREVRTTE